MEIKVKTLTGKEILIQTEPTNTIADLKIKIEEQSGVPPAQQRLIFQGRQQQDVRTLNDCNIIDGAILHLVLALRGG